MPLKLDHLRILHTRMRPSNTHNLSHRVIYHHLFISARSPLIPRDRSLSLTTDSTTHTLTPKGTDATPTRQHCLHLFLNLYKRSPYIQYTYEGGYHNNCTVSEQRLTITTSLYSSVISSKRPTHQYMMYTTSHTPDHRISPAPNDHTNLGHPHTHVDTST